MVAVPKNEELKVTLEHPVELSSGHKTIRVTYGGDYKLDISLRRTVRVPDNDTAYDLPPDCGPFPVYSVKNHKSQLPNSIASKGGLFMPIYGKSSPYSVCSVSIYSWYTLYFSGVC